MPFQSTLPRRKRRLKSCVNSTRSYFNPRFREGSDSVFIDPPTIDRHFNPRFREGSDKIHPRRACGTDMISIHASAKEATESNYSAALPVLFQSTLPRRKRLALNRFDHVVTDFNPRFREGSDNITDSLTSLARDFNPRFREGSDSRYVQFSCVYLQKS